MILLIKHGGWPISHCFFFLYCFFYIFLISCSSHKHCCWSSETFSVKKEISLSFLQPDHAPLFVPLCPTRNWKDELHGRTPTSKAPGCARAWACACVQKGNARDENVCVPSLIRKFNWMEFGSFFSPPLELAAINRLFSFPFILQWFVVLHLLCWHCLC